MMEAPTTSSTLSPQSRLAQGSDAAICLAARHSSARVGTVIVVSIVPSRSDAVHDTFAARGMRFDTEFHSVSMRASEPGRSRTSVRPSLLRV